MRRQPGSLEDAIIAVLGRRPAMSVAEVRTELHRRRSPDRADVLASFVAGLDPADEAVLRKLLADSDSGAM